MVGHQQHRRPRTREDTFMTTRSNTAALALEPVLEAVTANFDDSVQRLAEFLRIPSVSTDPAFKSETRLAGSWLVDELRTMGFNAELRDTPGHPMVVAHHPGPGGSGDGDGASGASEIPHVLYYGHYDVQPADPLELWESGPFEPRVVEGPHGKRIVARGAADDKGQVMTFVEAFRAWHTAHGTLPVAVSVMIEGEEESGSESLEPFLESARDELAADVCVVSDTGMLDIDTPCVTTGLRGMVYIEATLHGPSHDLHSGMYGGVLVNPCNSLCRVLAQLHDDRGAVAIPGFYDGIEEISDDQRSQWEALPFDEGAFLAGAGVRTPFGEPGRSTLERMWSRPTCDINGLKGGYIGAGAKTVIGSHASAKISCRLVAGQDPKRIHDALIAHLESLTPPDGRWEFRSHGQAPAIAVPSDSPWLAAAERGLEAIYGRPALRIGCGGSIPAVGSIRRILGVDSLLVGFAQEDDLVHSPNEKFELTCLERGTRAHAAMLAEFAALQR